MKSTFRFAVFFGTFLILVSCKTGKNSTGASEDTSGIIPSKNETQLEARILSTSSRLDPDTALICGKTPCYAKIEIIKVNQYGDRFMQTIAPGDSLDVKFQKGWDKHTAFSSKPLKMGDTILGNVQYRPRPDDLPPLYLITEYQRKP